MKINRSVLNFWNAHITTIVLIVLLLVFIGSSVFFALKLKPAIIPDEPHHFLVSKILSTTWGIPPDTPGTIGLGGLNHKPFLFHWINARIINLLSLAIPVLSERSLLIFLRILGVIYSTITVIFGYLLAKEVIENRWGQLFVVFLLTNTLMFVFLSGGNNYDNLLNLCSFAGIYYLTRVFNGRSFYSNSLMWLMCILFGALVKISMLPLAGITGLVWLLYIVKNRKIIDFGFTWDFKSISISLICIALFAVNFAIYGVNIVKYRTLYPACVQTFTKKQCKSYPQYVRNQDLGLKKKLSLIDVVNGGYPDPIEYGFDYWISSMLKRIYGIMGHKSYFPDVSITAHRLLILWTIFITIKYWKRPSYTIMSLYIILFFYILNIFQLNYNSELIFGFKHVGIQGRYLFPVIGVYYTLMVYFFLKIPSTFFRRLTFVAATFLFLYGSPIVFLLRFYNSILSDWFI